MDFEGSILRLFYAYSDFWTVSLNVNSKKKVGSTDYIWPSCKFKGIVARYKR